MADNYGPYTTPGSAVADQLQEILARKRAESRQAMLDQLNKQNVESEISARNLRAQTDEENRKSLASDRQAQEVQRRAALLSPHQILTPEDATYFQQRGAGSLVDPGQAGTAPLGPEDQGPSMPAIPAQFHGLPIQLETEHKTKETTAETAEFARRQQAIMDDPDTPTEIKQWMLMRAALPKGEAPAPPTIWNPKPEDQAPLMQFDESTGKFTPAVGPEGKPIMGKRGEIIKRPYAPQPSAANVPNFQFIEEVDQTGQKTGKVIAVNTKTGAGKYAEMPAGAVGFGLRLGTQPSGATKPSKISDTTWKEFLSARTANNPEFIGTTGGKIISEFPTSADVKEAIRAGWANLANRTKRADQLQFNGSDKDISDAKELWSLLTQ